jgi:acyl-homoserine lactone acylase PvdQ
MDPFSQQKVAAKRTRRIFHPQSRCQTRNRSKASHLHGAWDEYRSSNSRDSVVVASLWIRAAVKKILNLAVKEGGFRVERKASVKTDFSCSVEVSTPTELISGKAVCNQ